MARRDSSVYSTIRHVSCRVLLSSGEEVRCGQCTQYRKVLHAMLFREHNHSDTSVSRTDADSHVNYRYLKTPEKIERLQALHHQNRLCLKRLSRLQSKLHEVIEQQSVVVDEPVADDLSQIMEEEEVQVQSLFPEGSFQQVFWQQQKQAVQQKDKRGIRWHPLMIRFCLYLRHHSGKAYEALRNSGCIVLPSQRTLRDYSHAVKAEAGFSKEVDHQLMMAAKIDTCKEWEKLVVILLDEMYIREDLVYEKHSGSLIGFVNLGEINNHLLAFEQSLNEDSPLAGTLAKTVLTIMVKGIFTSLRYPYAHFFSATLTGELMFQPFWEAVYRLERIGLKVTFRTYIPSVF